MRLLIGHGCSINAKNKRNLNTPLMYANKPKAVKFLLDNKAEVYCKNKLGQSALDLAKGKSRRILAPLFRAQDSKAKKAEEELLRLIGNEKSPKKKKKKKRKKKRSEG